MHGGEPNRGVGGPKAAVAASALQKFEEEAAFFIGHGVNMQQFTALIAPIVEHIARL